MKKDILLNLQKVNFFGIWISAVAFMLLNIFYITFAIAQKPVLEIISQDVTGYPAIKINYSFIPPQPGPLAMENPVMTEEGRDCILKSLNSNPFTPEVNLHFILANCKPRDLSFLLSKSNLFTKEGSPLVSARMYALSDDSVTISLPLNEGTEDLLIDKRYQLTLNELYNFYESHKADFKPADIIFFIVKGITLDELAKFILLFPVENPMNQPMVCIVCDDIAKRKTDSISQRLSPPLLVFSHDYFKTRVIDQIMEFFNPWINRNYSLEVNIPDSLNLSTIRQYSLLLDAAGIKTSDEFEITYNPQQIQDYFTSLSLNQAALLIAEENFLDGIKLLKIRRSSLLKNNYIDTIIQQKGYESILDYGKWLADKKAVNSFDKYAEALRVWGLPDDDVFKKQELEVLESFYDNLSDSTGTEIERAVIADCLRSRNNNPKYEAFYHNSKGDYELNLSNYWKAAGWYTKSLGYLNYEAVAAKKANAVIRGVEKSFNTADYDSLYSLVQDYKAIVISGFLPRLQYAIASYESSHFAEALLQFEWLYDHWQNQSLMSAETAFKRILSLASATANYDKAMAFSKQYFIDDKNRQQQKNGLMLYLLNARARCYHPIISLAPLTLSSTTDISVRNLNPPSDVTFMGIVDPSLAVIKAYVTKENIKAASSLISSARSFPLFLTNDQGTMGWLVNEISGNRYFLIQITNQNNSLAEKELLEKINKAPFISSNWENLASLQEDKGFNFLSRSICALAEAGLGRGKNISAYWNLLKRFNFIQYMILHQPGNANQPFGAILPVESYPSGEWLKSSSAAAFYEIDLSKGNKTIKDITNPLLIGGRYGGALRLGLQKK